MNAILHNPDGTTLQRTLTYPVQRVFVPDLSGVKPSTETLELRHPDDPVILDGLGQREYYFTHEDAQGRHYTLAGAL